MAAKSVLAAFLGEITPTDGYNRYGSYQRLISRTLTSSEYNDEQLLVDPQELTKKLVIPRVLPAGTRTPSPQGTPAKIAPPPDRLTLDYFGIKETDLRLTRANAAGSVKSSVTVSSLSTIIKQINEHEPERGREKLISQIPRTKDKQVPLLREYFGLPPLDQTAGSTTQRTKKSGK